MTSGRRTHFRQVNGVSREGAEKIVSGREPCSRRLKPHSERCGYRSGELLRHPKAGANPQLHAPVESHPCAKNAQGWSTRLDGGSQ